MTPDLGYAWIVYPRREDLPPVAQGHSAKKTAAVMIVEIILAFEDLAERGELTGPGGQAWTCRLEPVAPEDPLFPEGRPHWEPGKP